VTHFGRRSGKCAPENGHLKQLIVKAKLNYNQAGRVQVNMTDKVSPERFFFNTTFLLLLKPLAPRLASPYPHHILPCIATTHSILALDSLLIYGRVATSRLEFKSSPLFPNVFPTWILSGSKERAVCRSLTASSKPAVVPSL